MSTYWKYGRWAVGSSIELGQLQLAQSTALACHIHADVQISAVKEGWRIYTTPWGEFRATAGDIVVIPATVPHASHGSIGALVTHLYVPSEHAAVRSILRPRHLRPSRPVVQDEILDTLGSADLKAEISFPKPSALADFGLRDDLDIAATAARLGCSTDGFIRAFKRQIGMTPAAYRLAMRLASARAALKRGDIVADVAYAGSFADQSHFGRLFRRAYGTTPAAYRSAFAVG